MKINHCKIIIGIFCAVFLASPSTRAATLLSAGDTFNFEFTTITDNNGTTPSVFNYASFTFGIENLLYGGESMRLTMYENTLLDTPILTDVISGVGNLGDLVASGYGFAYTSGSLPEIPFTDFQGILQLSVISGDISIESVTVGTDFGGTFYSQTYPIPEPTTTLLILVACILTIIKHKSNHVMNPTRFARRS